MSVQELKAALREALDQRGVLDTIRANMRHEVFRAMEDPDGVRPPISPENLLINELIRDYLDFNNYRHTLAVFMPEAGQPAEPMRRDVLAYQTKLPQVVSSGDGDVPGKPLPLLYALLAPQNQSGHRAPPARVPLRAPTEGSASALAASEPTGAPPPAVPASSATHAAAARGGPEPIMFTG